MMMMMMECISDNIIIQNLQLFQKRSVFFRQLCTCMTAKSIEWSSHILFYWCCLCHIPLCFILKRITDVTEFSRHLYSSSYFRNWCDSLLQYALYVSEIALKKKNAGLKLDVNSWCMNRCAQF